MAWMLVNPQIHNTFASLGCQQGEAYKVNDDCLGILNEILNNLIVEDRTLRTFRRAIGFGQYIRKDLLPLLIHVKDDTNIANSSKIIDLIIKILVNLTIPVECLISTDALSRTTVGRHTIFEINKLLLSSKEAFVDSKSTKAVLDHIQYVVEKKGSKLEVDQCDSINNCLLLLRNILHVPENRNQISNCVLAHNSMQNQILWNLFTQSIDKLLIYLMACPQKIYWVVSMVQLIALMYKDQHVGTLQKLLNQWFDTSLSDSSDDNESNTSPPNQNSDDSSPNLTSDPTSDSSDNGFGGNSNESRSIEIVTTKQHITRSVQNRNKVLLTSQKLASHKNGDAESSSSSSCDNKSSSNTSSLSGGSISHSNIHTSSHNNSHNKKQESLQSEYSDYGYGTQIENQESVSTSSNDDEVPVKKPIHQKPHTVQKQWFTKQRYPQDKKEARRKKLIKRSKTHMINMKVLTNHSPTDENISNILKEFTVDFLLKGYGSLVNDLYTQLLNNFHLQIDTSHFFWLITYFLKFAVQLELDFEHIKPVISINILSYLIFEGITLCEQLGNNKNEMKMDLKPYLRRTHLVVTAIREYLQTVNSYKKISHLSKEDHDCIVKLQCQIASIENFRSLFLLLLRQYNPTIQSKQYLQDLITTNHILLLFLDEASKLPTYTGKDKIMDHLKQFATVDIMHKYGLLLEEFENNGKYVNDCVFTMMHHIGGDLENVAALFQPHILKTFSKIWESDYEICDDWSDLIEYVIHKFINVPRSNDNHASTAIVQQEIEKSTPTFTTKTESCNEWPQDDLDVLYWYYMESRKSDNIIENIIKQYEENGRSTKSKISVAKQLLKQNLINQDLYEILLQNENLMDDSNGNSEECESQDIKLLKEELLRENVGDSILWLQQILIEACCCKIYISHKEFFQDIDTIFEPIPYCYSKLNWSIPLIPWNEEHWKILNLQTFILLLHKLGFHLPAETGKLFVRIPNFWTADYMFSIAQKLGPVDTSILKFDISKVLSHEKSKDPIQDTTAMDTKETSISTILTQHTPMVDAAPCWYQTVLQSKPANLMEVINEVPRNIEVPMAISISDNEVLPCEIPVPHLNEVNEITKVIHLDKISQINTTCIKSIINVHEECEHNSIDDTVSVTSDLTRMCVSDEERDIII